MKGLIIVWWLARVRRILNAGRRLLSAREVLSACLMKGTQIDHFRISFGLFFKASLSAHPFIWKLVFIHMQIKTNFHMKKWAPGLPLKKRSKVIGHVRYINSLTWLRGFRIKIANFSSFSCISIPKRDLDTKKTTPNMEVWPESLGAMLEYWYIGRGLFGNMAYCLYCKSYITLSFTFLWVI